MAKAKLYVLDGGKTFVDRGFIHMYNGRGEVFPMANNSYYIDHPKARILVDTGFDTQDWYPGQYPFLGPVSWEQSAEQNVAAQLEKIDVSVDDIDYVVMTHLHVDHTGYLPLFGGKKAKIIVQRRELEHAYVPMPFTWTARRTFDRPDLNYELITGSCELVGGVEIMLTTGHTPGGQSLVVRLGNMGTIILVGFCSTQENFAGKGVERRGKLIPPPMSYSNADAVESMRRILMLAARHEAQIFYPHDRRLFEAMRHVPEYYD